MKHENILIRHNIVPTLTPLKKENGETIIDKESLHKLRLHLQSLGVKGVLIMGTTGILFKSNRKEIERKRKEVKRKRKWRNNNRQRIFA
eukprot:Phypoly_transcript_23197.p1 GENE.Phypoly_transcript_23197~~Phypoly_transcript_23197.p1  ORF type:complete len:101 (+),score=9.89 Phypoly_transcript_23197:37-303(+)